ncbi:MAG: MBL fold metallo-hydrolase [Smithellaceae bacterium]|nr:MBL fold metallo-hydrolase [Syntrophaceae bacterium]MDD4241594.1 MBL fold metallo-hydrolase [Smithellaceae bacterium]
MAGLFLNAVDKVEIWTLQDNYIEMTALDNTAVVTRATSLKDGEIKASILAEHGFSALLKTTAGEKTHMLLFDFGFSEDGAVKNAALLGLDLRDVEAAALSHGHSDHTGAMKAFGAAIGKKDVPLVVHPSAFKAPRYLKFGESFKAYFPRFTREMVQEAGFHPVETEIPYSLLDNAFLVLGGIPRKTDFETGWSIVHRLEEGKEVWDAIEDDTSVVMHLQDKGLVILSGCAHAGIVNTVQYAIETTGVRQIHAVMGGFHLSGPFFEPIIGRTASELQKFKPSHIIPTHCTGRKAIMEIEKKMPKQFILNMAGTKLTFV